MITLNLLQYLENNGFGHIDDDLLWEKLTLGKDGVYCQSLGDNNARGARRSCRFELYSRSSKSDMDGYRKLAEIAKFLTESYAVCELPKVERNGKVIAEAVPNCTIMPLSSIANNGLDDNNRVIWTISGQIYY